LQAVDLGADIIGEAIVFGETLISANCKLVSFRIDLQVSPLSWRLQNTTGEWERVDVKVVSTGWLNFRIFFRSSAKTKQKEDELMDRLSAMNRQVDLIGM